MPIKTSVFNKGSEVVPGQPRKGWKDQIYKYIKKHAKDGQAVSRGDISKELGIRVQMVKQYLDDMVDKGLVSVKECSVPGESAHLWYTITE